MGRLGTNMAVVFAGWGPSVRRFKSCLPDQREPAWEAGSHISRQLQGEAGRASWYQLWYQGSRSENSGPPGPRQPLAPAPALPAAENGRKVPPRSRSIGGIELDLDGHAALFIP
jgi:hypothetical protein